MAVYDNSRYLHTHLYTRLGSDSPLLQIRERFTFNTEKCTMYEWRAGDTLDGVAYKHYGISALRWAILDANPKYRTEFDIEDGDKILIPDYEEVVNIVDV